MHELSIALDLIEAVCDELPALGRPRVRTVHLKLGVLSGVVEEALLFSFGVAADGSPLEGARLEIEKIPVTVFCDTCRRDGIAADPRHLRCPSCGAPTERLVRGRELELVGLEVEDDAADRRGTAQPAQEER